jgi:hypothetical protein
MQLSQSIVRRRKEDTGEPLVERTYCPVRVPFGQRQREPHEKWLKGFERFFCETHPHSPLVEGAWCTRSRPRSANAAEARVRRRPSRRRPGTRLDRDHRLELDPEDAQAARTLPGTRRGRRRGAGRLVPDRDRPHPRRAGRGSGACAPYTSSRSATAAPRPRTRANARPRCTSSWRATPTCSAPDAHARREGRQLGALMALTGSAPRPSSTRM